MRNRSPASIRIDATFPAEWFLTAITSCGSPPTWLEDGIRKVLVSIQRS